MPLASFKEVLLQSVLSQDHRQLHLDSNHGVLHLGLCVTWGLPWIIVLLTSTYFNITKTSGQTKSKFCTFFDAVCQRVCLDEPISAIGCICCSPWKHLLQSKLRTWEWSAWPRRYSLQKHRVRSVSQSLEWSHLWENCTCRRHESNFFWQSLGLSHSSKNCSLKRSKAQPLSLNQEWKRFSRICNLGRQNLKFQWRSLGSSHSSEKCSL